MFDYLSITDGGCLVESFDVPALSIRHSPYKNGIIIRGIRRDISKNDLLNQIAGALDLRMNIDNLLGVYFIFEYDSDGDLSVVLLLRNVNKLFKTLKEKHEHQSDFCFIRIDGSLKEVLDLRKSNLSLMFSSNDSKLLCKLYSFDNLRSLSLHQAWNMFEKLFVNKPDDLKSLIVTGKKVFLIVSSNNYYADILRTLILEFGTDLNMQEASECLVFVRKSQKVSLTFAMDSDIKVEFAV